MTPPLQLGLGMGLARGGFINPVLLDLDFTAGFPSELTHSRASGATYVDESGLVKQANENLLPWTDLSSAQWVTTTCTKEASPLPDPLGGSDAILLKADTAGGSGNLSIYDSPDITLVVGVPIVISTYARAIDGAENVFRYAGFGVDVRYDLELETVTFESYSGSGTAWVETIGEPGADGFRWLRLCAKFNYSVSATLYIGAASITRDGRSLFLVSKPQIQRGYEAQAHVATSGASKYLPRITHDPATLDPLGYLHEPAATNYVKYYNATNGNGNMSPTDGSTTTANYGVAPNGLTQTIRLVDNSTLYGFGVALNNTEIATIPANSTITGSVYLRKKSSSTYVGSIVLYCSGGTVAAATTHLNYVTGVATSPSTAGPMSSASVKVTDAGDFWRVAITGTDGGSNTTARLLLYPSPRTTALVVDATLTGECEYWGHQIELGSAATSLIPTFGASATRAADVVQPVVIPALSQGTLLIDVGTEPNYPSAATNSLIAMLALASSPTNERVLLHSRTARADKIQLAVLAGGTGSLSEPDAPAPTGAENINRIGAAWSASANRLSVDGSTHVADGVTYTPASVDRLYLNSISGYQDAPRIIRSIKIAPDAKAQATLNTLTTP